MARCACGCSQTLPDRPHHSYRPARFIHGHFSRTARYREIRLTAGRVAVPTKSQIPTGRCECGCGGRTRPARVTSEKHGTFRGYPLRFLHGHNTRGKRAHGWKGGRKITPQGYVLLFLPKHPLANSAGYVLEHRLVWQRTHRRRLLKDEEVHHVDGDRGNNAPSNLVAMSKSQHAKEHRGDPDFRARVAASIRKALRSPEVNKKLRAAATTAWARRKDHARSSDH